MLTIKLLILEVGALLVYAGITGKSVGSLVRGQDVAASNMELAS